MTTRIMTAETDRGRIIVRERVEHECSPEGGEVERAASGDTPDELDALLGAVGAELPPPLQATLAEVLAAASAWLEKEPALGAAVPNFSATIAADGSMLVQVLFAPGQIAEMVRGVDPSSWQMVQNISGLARMMYSGE